MSGVAGGGAGWFRAEATRRSGIRPSMATIMERALTCPTRLPRVISGLMWAISQRRVRIWSRVTVKVRGWSAVLCSTSSGCAAGCSWMWAWSVTSFLGMVAPLVEKLRVASKGFPPAAGRKVTKNPAAAGCWVKSIERWFGYGTGQENTVLRSRLGRDFRQLHGSERLGEEPLRAGIGYEISVQEYLVPGNGERLSFMTDEW